MAPQLAALALLMANPGGGLSVTVSTPDGGPIDLAKCHITADKGDRVRKGGDVVVKAGETVGDAIAVEGNVIVKSGATVKSALALHGSVIVEDGATVNGSVVAFGGQALVSKTAKVAEGQVAMDGTSLKIVSDEGQDVEISAAFGGKNIAELLLKPVLEKLHDCEVGTKE